MKHWEEVGEVPDSEDEDLDLDTQPLQPGLVKKKSGQHDYDNICGDSDKENDFRQLLDHDDYGLRHLLGSDTLLDAVPSAKLDSINKTATELELDAQRPLFRPQQLSQSSASQLSFRTAPASAAPRSDHAAIPPGTPLRPTTSYGILLSQSSSPLSVLSVSPPPPSKVAVTTVSAQPAEASRDPEYLAIVRTLEAENVAQHSHRRNLRQRTTKQLHPFLEEQARYLQLCKDRGMRPVRVLETNAQTNNNVSQLAASPEQMSSQFSIGSPVAPTSHSPQSQSSFDAFAIPEDDTADFLHRNALGESPRAGEVRSDGKRRKLDHAPAVCNSSIQNEWSADRMSALPPSPSLSPGPDIQLPLSLPKPPPRFRMPPGMTPQMSLPTPEVSSEPQVTEELSAPRTHSSTVTPSRGFRSIVLDDSESESDSSDAHPQQTSATTIDTRRLEAQKKRIRGVLPASWLKIDMLAQTKRDSLPRRASTSEQISVPTTPAVPAKGVAQRVSRANNSNTAASAVMLSDTDEYEESDNDDQPAFKQPRLHFEPSRNTTSFVDDDEMEHDWVDPMLQGGSSTVRQHNRSRMRQPLIRDVLPRTDTNQPTRETLDESERMQSQYHRRCSKSGSRHHRRRAPTSGQRHRNPRKVPQLSILDVAARPTHTNDSRPSFVRIAARQARKAPHQARHSPSTKLVRLATRQDTEDAAATLRQWRAGTIAPRTSSETTESLPRLTEITARPSIARPQRRQFLDYRQQPRTAQLEVLETARSEQFRALVFQERIAALARGAFNRRHAHGPQQMPQLDSNANVMAWQDREADGASPDANSLSVNVPRSKPQSNTAPDRLGHRKRLPMRIDVDAEEYAQAVEVQQQDIASSPSGGRTNSSGRPRLDLTSLALSSGDFDVQPLPANITFPCSTFIGSGDFANSLIFADRALHEPSGKITIQIGHEVNEWTAWTQSIKSDLSKLYEAIVNAVAMLRIYQPSQPRPQQIVNVMRNISYLLQSVVRYLTYCCYFHDEIDRKDCIEALRRLCQDVNTLVSGQDLLGDDVACVKSTTLQYILILSHQASKLATHSSITYDIRANCQDITQLIANSLAMTLTTQRPVDLTTCYHDLRAGNLTCLSDECTVSSIVIMHHIVQTTTTGSSFWRVLNDVLDTDLKSTLLSTDMDRVWRTIFDIVPFLDFDKHGKISKQSFKGRPDDWSLLQVIVKRVFELYDETVRVPGSPVNRYIRALLMRSMSLITQWHWYKCEIWLASFFDFFVHRRFSLLKGEVSTGSPAFLDDLAGYVDLALKPSDTSYHMFLKVLGTAIQSMRRYSVYAEKKIRTVLWRFIPGKPRVYHKDTSMEQIDLDSLRNHYDLLCTLYFAAPPNHRIGISVLEGVVDHKTSHRAACRMSVRAWTCLAAFQASLNEPPSRLEPIVEWFRSITSITLSQYKLARTEAEDDFHKLRANGSAAVSHTHLESIVASNQAQITATMIDLLAGIKRAISQARNFESALHLVQGSEYLKILTDLDGTARPLKVVFVEGLSAVSACILRFHKPVSALSQSEDSQDYGNDIDLDDCALATVDNHTFIDAVISLHNPPISQLMSNLFGADSCPDDALLVKAIDVWLSLVNVSVQHKKITWDEVLYGYGTASWKQLRDTSQHKVYTAYFMSRVIASVRTATQLPLQAIFTAWTVSLIARESVLRFQHELTNSILNAWHNEAMLRNLPFARSLTTLLYNVSLHDIRQRRIALLSALFSNMRDDLENDRSFSQNQERRRMYADMLRQMMTAMRSNYNEVQGSADTAGYANGHSTYIEFVQSIVSLMQQYTTGICSIDRFFTDSVAFPLPAGDPTYVVGRLRNYALRLGQPNAWKELAVFIHTVCERALVDGQQPYLINQLVLATGSDMEQGTATSSLRHFFLVAVLPIYISMITKHEYGWCPTLTMLKAGKVIVRGLITNLDINSIGSKAAIEEMLLSVIEATTEGFDQNIDRFDTISIGRTQVVRSLLELCSECLVTSEYLSRPKGQGRRLAARLQWFAARCEQYERQLAGIVNVDATDGDDDLERQSDHVDAVRLPWSEARSFISRQLVRSFDTDWAEVGGGLSLRRGAVWKRIVHEDQSRETGATLYDAVRRYLSKYHRLFARRPNRKGRDITAAISTLPVL